MNKRFYICPKCNKRLPVSGSGKLPDHKPMKQADRCTGSFIKVA